MFNNNIPAPASSNQNSPIPPGLLVNGEMKERPITPKISSIYHSTSTEIAKKIMSGEGIVPRSITGLSSKYDDFPSNPECVYLTYSHGAFFASSQTGDDRILKARAQGGRIEDLSSAIIEIDGTLLDESLFYPDEDFLEQSNLGKDDIKGGEKERTAYYRSIMLERQSEWQEGFAGCGTIAYRGVVPVSAIKRVAYVNFLGNSNPKVGKQLATMLMDYISGDFNSYKRFPLFGQTHRELTEAFFGDRRHVNNKLVNVSKAVRVQYNTKYKK